MKMISFCLMFSFLLTQVLNVAAATHVFVEAEDGLRITEVASGKTPTDLMAALSQLQSLASIPENYIPNFRYALIEIGDKLMGEKNFEGAAKAYALALQYGALDHNYDFREFVKTELNVSAPYSKDQILRALTNKYPPS